MYYARKKALKIQVQTCQLKRRPKQRHINAVVLGGPDKSIRMLIDSGADVIGCKNKSNGAFVHDFSAEVGTCSTGTMMATEGMGQLNFELLFGRKITANDVIFAKELSHNIAGSTVLDREHGIASFFYEGEVYLVDNRSIGRVPPTWAVLARSKYDPVSGLPFVDVRLKAKTLEFGQLNVAETRILENQPNSDGSCDVPRALEAEALTPALSDEDCSVMPYPYHEGMEYQLENSPCITQTRASFEIGPTAS